MESIDDFIVNINKLFLDESSWDAREKHIEGAMCELDLKSSDISKYTFWDYNKSYTRNLITTNNNFSLLLLCWSPGKESKIHNHPCDGCFGTPQHIDYLP
jgi:predicted metal-dependent enzyme (double-stranded beta helix superfamily)